MSALQTIKDVINNGTGHTFGELNGRYIVSLPGEQVFRDVQSDDAERVAIEVLDRFILAKPGQAPGIWMYEGDLYLDTSESYDAYSVAVWVAREREQLAVYDQVKGITINV